MDQIANSFFVKSNDNNKKKKILKKRNISLNVFLIYITLISLHSHYNTAAVRNI